MKINPQTISKMVISSKIANNINLKECYRLVDSDNIVGVTKYIRRVSGSK